MSDGIYVALSGALAQTATLDATASNLANASTDGYERERPIFREALARADGHGATLRSVTAATTLLDTTRGALRTTGRPLDVTLPEGAYLAVHTTGGERYTRSGSLRVASDGTLTTSNGSSLVADDGRIIRTDPSATDVRITPSGEVRQGASMLARLRVVEFPRADRLAPEGGALLAATEATGTPVASKGELAIGSLEGSNTSVVGAMTELVTASRNFDAFQRAIDAFHDADHLLVTSVPGDS
jgi:flagellar basal body rod protein FlgG